MHLVIAEVWGFVYLCMCLKTDDNTVSVSYTWDSIKIMIAFNRRYENALSKTVADKPAFNVHSAFSIPSNKAALWRGCFLHTKFRLWNEFYRFRGRGRGKGKAVP